MRSAASKQVRFLCCILDEAYVGQVSCETHFAAITPKLLSGRVLGIDIKAAYAGRARQCTRSFDIWREEIARYERKPRAYHQFAKPVIKPCANRHSDVT